MSTHLRQRTIGRGLKFYATILAKLKEGKATALALSRSIGADESGMRSILRQMHRLGGMVHIAGWEPARERAGGIHTALWGFGAGPDVPAPVGRFGRPNTTLRLGSVRIRKDLRNFGELWKALAEAPTSIPELVQMTGIHRETLRKLVRDMRDLRLVRIALWDTNYRCPVAFYRLGASSDTPRPQPLTRQEIRARRIERQRGHAQIERLITGARSPFDLMTAQLSA